VYGTLRIQVFDADFNEGKAFSLGSGGAMNAPVAKDAGMRGRRAMLDRLLPMHLLLSRDKTIRHAGPTLCKMAGRDPLPGRPADDVIELRRPCGLDRFDKLLATARRTADAGLARGR
jgi:hypothetical protein